MTLAIEEVDLDNIIEIQVTKLQAVLKALLKRCGEQDRTISDQALSLQQLRSELTAVSTQLADDKSSLQQLQLASEEAKALQQELASAGQDQQQQLQAQAAEVRELAERLVSAEGLAGEQEGRLEHLEGRLGAAEGGLAKLEGSLAKLEGLDGLERRLEEQVKEAASQGEEQKAGLLALEGRCREARGELESKLLERLQALQRQVEALPSVAARGDAGSGAAEAVGRAAAVAAKSTDKDGPVSAKSREALAAAGQQSMQEQSSAAQGGASEGPLSPSSRAADRALKESRQEVERLARKSEAAAAKQEELLAKMREESLTASSRLEERMRALEQDSGAARVAAMAERMRGLEGALGGQTARLKELQETLTPAQEEALEAVRSGLREAVALDFSRQLSAQLRGVQDRELAARERTGREIAELRAQIELVLNLGSAATARCLSCYVKRSQTEADFMNGSDGKVYQSRLGEVQQHHSPSSSERLPTVQLRGSHKPGSKAPLSGGAGATLHARRHAERPPSRAASALTLEGPTSPVWRDELQEAV